MIVVVGAMIMIFVKKEMSLGLILNLLIVVRDLGFIILEYVDMLRVER